MFTMNNLARKDEFQMDIPYCNNSRLASHIKVDTVKNEKFCVIEGIK